MSLDKYRNSIKTYKRLLESDTLGSFDFFTSTVCLDSILLRDFEEFRRALKSNDYDSLTKVIPLAVHEYTHFIDSTSTLWGLRHLAKMNDAYGSNNVNGGKEEEFYKAKEFLEHVRSLRLPNYYTLVNSNIEKTTPWQYRITIGKQFGLDGKLSEKPILFSHFANANGQLLARSPISTVSILEASAMSHETFARIGLIDTLKPGVRDVEMRIFKRDSVSYLYNQNITEYSVCVHVLANHLQCTDLLVAFRICSIITRIVLNTPSSLLLEISSRAEIHEILDIPQGHEFENRMYEGLRHGNLGVLYYLICRALPKDTHESKGKIIDGIATALESLGVSFELLTQEAKSEARILFNTLSGSRLESIRILAMAGEENFNSIDMKSGDLSFHNLSLPPVYLGDGEEVFIFSNDNSRLKDIALNKIFDELYGGQEWVERFSESCTA